MLYREAGQYKTSYVADQAVFPLLQDRIGIAVILFLAVIPVMVWNVRQFRAQEAAR